MSAELRLSCAHSAFPALSLDVALAVVRDLGFDAVDVCTFTGYEHIPPDTVVADPRGAARQVHARLEHHRLAASDVFAIVGSSFDALAPNHPHAEVREESLRQFERFVAFTRELGAPGLTILPGTDFDADDDSLRRAGDALARRAEIAAARGLRLSFEPHYGSIAGTPERTLELLELAPGASLALDYSHFVFQDIPESRIDPLLPHTGHFHIRQAAPGAMQTRIGEGTIDFARLRDELLAQGYDGYFAFEYQWDPDWLDFTHVDCLAETAASRDALLARAAS